MARATHADDDARTSAAPAPAPPACRGSAAARPDHSPAGRLGQPRQGRRGPDDPLVLSPRHDRDPPRRQPAGVARRSHGPRRRGRHRPRAGQGGGRRAGGRRGPRPRAAARRRRRHRDRHAQERRRLPLRDAPLGRPRHGRGRPVARARDQLGFGPPIDDGFYYDFDPPRPLTEEDFPRDRGRDGADHRRRVAVPAHRHEHRATPREYFAERGEDYKVDQVDELAGRGEATVSLYRDGDFVDLCQGPHLHDTGRIGAVKLLSVAGAYWRGSEKNPQLTRVYATAFPDVEGARGAPGAPRGGPRARPPPARARARASSTSTTPARDSRSSCRTGWSWSTASGRPCATTSSGWATTRSRRPTLLSEELWHTQRPLGPLPRQHVLHRGRRGSGSRSSR